MYTIPKDIEDYIIDFGFQKCDTGGFVTPYIENDWQYIINVNPKGSYSLKIIDHRVKEKWHEITVFKFYTVNSVDEIKYLLNNTTCLCGFPKAQLG